MALSCKFGGRKQANAPSFFIIDDNPFCFLFGTGSELCKIGKIVVKVADAKKPIKAIIRAIIREAIKTVIDGNLINTAKFCELERPSDPGSVTLSDITAYLLYLADPTGFLPSGDLPDKCKTFWLMKNWDKYCECKPIDLPDPNKPPIPNPNDPIPPLPSEPAITCSENASLFNGGQIRGAIKDRQRQSEGRQYWAEIMAKECPNPGERGKSLVPPMTFRIFRRIGYKIYQYMFVPTGIIVETCSNISYGYLYSFAVWICDEDENPPNPDPLPDELEDGDFDLKKFCIEYPNHLLCFDKKKKDCCKHRERFYGLWLPDPNI